MKRILVLMFALLMLAGCSTKSSYQTLLPEVQVAPDSTFHSVNVEDKSGFIFEEDSDEKIVLSDTMQSSLNAALVDVGIYSTAIESYTLKTEILSYSPGNAFARWLVPGAGETELDTVTYVYTPDNKLFAKIPVNKSIAAGGGYTVGAWKYIFKDVAKEIVSVLQKKALASK